MLQRCYHLMICGPKVYEPTGFSQASNMWLSQWKKARVNLAFQVNQGFTKSNFFLAEVLYVIRYKGTKSIKVQKKLNFVFHLCTALQHSFCEKLRFERLVNLPFNTIKAHLVAVFVFFATATSFIEIIFS